MIENVENIENIESVPQQETGTNAVELFEITPECYQIWAKRSKDPHNIRLAFKLNDSRIATVDTIVSEFAMLGLRVNYLQLFPNESLFQFIGVAYVPVEGPNSVLDYLWHKYQFAPNQKEHRATVELKESEGLNSSTA